MRRTVPVLISSIVGFILLASYFFNFSIPGTGMDLEGVSNEITDWGVIVAAFAVGLASINLIRIHVAKIVSMRSDWLYSVALIATMFVFISIGIYARHNPELLDEPGEGSARMDAQSLAHMVIIAFIVVGNIAYVMAKKTGDKPTASTH